MFSPSIVARGLSYFYPSMLISTPLRALSYIFFCQLLSIIKPSSSGEQRKRAQWKPQCKPQWRQRSVWQQRRFWNGVGNGSKHPQTKFGEKVSAFVTSRVLFFFFFHKRDMCLSLRNHCRWARPLSLPTQPLQTALPPPPLGHKRRATSALPLLRGLLL